MRYFRWLGFAPVVSCGYFGESVLFPMAVRGLPDDSFYFMRQLCSCRRGDFTPNASGGPTRG